MSSLLITSLTVFGIPYLALSWELTTNYDDRTRISGYRRFMEVVAEMISTLTIPVMLVIATASSSEAHEVTPLEESSYYPTAAAFMGIVVVAAAVVTFLGTKESDPVGHEKSEGFLCSVRATYGNKPFVILLATFTLVAVADRVTTSLLLYLLEHMHGVPKRDTVPLFLAYFFGSLASPVFWMSQARRFGKKTYIHPGNGVLGNGDCELCRDDMECLDALYHRRAHGSSKQRCAHSSRGN